MRQCRHFSRTTGTRLTLGSILTVSVRMTVFATPLVGPFGANAAGSHIESDDAPEFAAPTQVDALGAVNLFTGRHSSRTTSPAVPATILQQDIRGRVPYAQVESRL
jgi:hypothetical protein